MVGVVPPATATVTVPYTDIIVTLSTTESTSYETTTSYEEVLETVTAYSATSIATVNSSETHSNKKKCPISGNATLTDEQASKAKTDRQAAEQ